MKTKLNPPAVILLKSMLAEPGWSKSDNTATALKRLYWAGKLLAEVFVDENKTNEFELPDLVLPVCRDCVSWFVKEGRCPGGPGMLELITTFELYKE